MKPAKRSVIIRLHVFAFCRLKDAALFEFSILELEGNLINRALFKLRRAEWESENFPARLSTFDLHLFFLRYSHTREDGYLRLIKFPFFQVFKP